MLRYLLAALAAIVLITASLIPDDALARRGGGMRAGGFHGGGMRAAHVRGGAAYGGRGYRVAGGPRPSHPIAGRPGRPGYPGRPIAGRPGYPGRPVAGYPGYRPGWGYGAAAVGAAAAAGAYGYYNNNYTHGCTYDTNGNWVCPGQYPYGYQH